MHEFLSCTKETIQTEYIWADFLTLSVNYKPDQIMSFLKISFGQETEIHLLK